MSVNNTESSWMYDKNKLRLAGFGQIDLRSFVCIHLPILDGFMDLFEFERPKNERLLKGYSHPGWNVAQSRNKWININKWPNWVWVLLLLGSWKQRQILIWLQDNVDLWTQCLEPKYLMIFCLYLPQRRRAIVTSAGGHDEMRVMKSFIVTGSLETTLKTSENKCFCL